MPDFHNANEWHLKSDFLRYLPIPERWQGKSRPGGVVMPSKMANIRNHHTLNEYYLITSSIAATAITVLIKSNATKLNKMKTIWLVSEPEAREASCLEVTGDRGQYWVIWPGGEHCSHIYTQRGAGSDTCQQQHYTFHNQAAGFHNNLEWWTIESTEFSLVMWSHDLIMHSLDAPHMLGRDSWHASVYVVM